MRKLIIHYHRDDQDYQGWGLWLWPRGYGGHWFEFNSSDDFGKIAYCELPQEHQELGFVIRGASWEKDVDQDRYIKYFRGNTAEVWLVAGDPQVYLAPPAHLRRDVRALEEVEVTLHYHRHDGDYDGWNLWLWGDHEPGRSLEFMSSDSYGQVARTVLRQQTDGADLGFILRKSVLGEEWATKEGTERFIPLYWTTETNKLEVWLLQDDPQIYYQHQDVELEPKLVRASLEDVTTIRVETYLPIYNNFGANWGFGLFCAENSLEIALETVRVHSADDRSSKSFSLRSKLPLDLAKHYLLKHPTHGTLPVSFGAVFSSREFHELFHYSGQDLGVSYSKRASTFKVWAPTANRLELVLYPEREPIPLKLGKKGVWSCTVKGNLEGVYYNYLVTHGEKTVKVVDPYARAAGVNGKRGQIVDLANTNPVGWEDLSPPKLENPVDAIIYELHIRDLSISPDSGIEAKGQYLGLIEAGTKTPEGIATGLAHLQELGITHVHLLPFFDFASVDENDPLASYNWGYDPLNYNLPEGSYASDPSDGRIRIRELKEMIQGLYQGDIGVIMDVVYNHSFHSLASSFNQLVPGYYYRHHLDGSFSNGSGCGNEFADERSMVRKFIVDSVSFWATEYKIAGFRFDLMGLHHLETMQAVRRALDLISPQILIYGEGWGAATSTLAPEKRALKENTKQIPGIASFASDFRDAIKGHVFNNHEGGFVQGAGFTETVKFGIVGAIDHPQIDFQNPWAAEPSQSVNYVEAHDNLTLWDKLLCTTFPSEEQERLQMMKLVHAILLTSQGIPFLHAGQDFARSKGGDPNSYQSPDHVNQIVWQRKAEFYDLFSYTKALIELRKKTAVFRLRSAQEIRDRLVFLNLKKKNMVGYVLKSKERGADSETMIVLFNANRESVCVEIPSGEWTVYLSGENVSKQASFRGCSVVVAGISALILGGREQDC